MAKFKPSLSEFSFAGITFSLREPDVKKDVRLFLNTKRSLFQFIEGYDNLYDVIRSWYEILKFLRDKISNLEERAGGLSGGEVAEVGKKCEELLLELNTFLTKYQSDYKRWYEQEIDSQTGAQATGQTATFRPFDQIQRSYSLYSNMIADIKRINAIMQEEFVPYFGINAEKWIEVKNRLTNGGIQRRLTQHMHKYIQKHMEEESMQLGINRAQILYNKILEEEAQPQVLLEEYIRYLNKYKCKGICVFISHKSEDKDTAKQIGDWLNRLGLDVYLDMFDDGLQQATQNNDCDKIVKHIQKAISVSTHVLVLISSVTQLSWWVPYEIGYAQKSGRDIASLLISNSAQRPDYLQILETLNSEDDLKKYAKALVNKNGKFQAIYG